MDDARAVRVELIDALGPRVQTLLEGPLGDDAVQTIRIDAAGLPSGRYFVRSVGETFFTSRKLIVLR